MQINIFESEMSCLILKPNISHIATVWFLCVYIYQILKVTSGLRNRVRETLV